MVPIEAPGVDRGMAIGGCVAHARTEMRVRRSMVLTTAVLVSVLALCVASPAAARSLAQDRPIDIKLSAKASNGYKAELDSEGDKLRLTFSRGLFPGLTYVFHGKVSAKGIEARIADLGQIDLQFVPIGKTRTIRTPLRCGNARARVAEGNFVGSVSFRAELNAVRLDFSRAQGWIGTPGWYCPTTSFKEFVESQPKGRTYTLLEAEEKKRRVLFSTYAGTDAEHPEPVGAEISAGMVTRRGPVKVDHLAVALAANVFSFDDELTSATFTAHKPFEGRGSYCASCAAGSSWTGDLRVSLPGIAGKVALAGSGFNATLKRFTSGVGGRSEAETVGG